MSLKIFGILNISVATGSNSSFDRDFPGPAPFPKTFSNASLCSLIIS